VQAIENGNFIRLKCNSVKTSALFDTGATKTCVSEHFVKRLRVKIQPLPPGHPVCYSSADGRPLIILGTVSLTLNIQGLRIPHIFTVVKELNYNLLLGTDFMHATQATIDFRNRTVSICDDLVVQPLVRSKLPRNVAHASTGVAIPAQCEAILPVRVNKTFARHNKHCLIEPLPSLQNLYISMARAIVPVHNNSSFCRVLNPTNATVYLKRHTPLGITSSLPINAVCEYTKSTSPQPTPLIDSSTQLQELQAKGLQVDATGFSDAQRDQLIALLYANRDLFTSDLSELPGTDVMTHTIDTGDARPIRQRPYRHSVEARKEIDRQIDVLLESGIIEPSDSPWGSPVVLVRKKNNTHRLCIDLRRVNSVTKASFFPLPLLEDVLHTVSENNPSIFTSLDMSSGFYQLPLDEASKPKTAFVTHRGNFHFKRLPFGISNAPASYQSLMAKVLRGILFSYALCYLDDILCMSDSPEKHCEHLSEIFDRFRQAKLRFNPNKCKIALPKVLYLGHVLSKDGVSVDESKVSLIQNFPVPQNSTQLRSFLGISNYYRKFIKHFSIKTANLRSLLKRDAKFVWNSAHQTEFDFLKQALTSAPILAFPNMQRDFILTTDACTSGIAYILSQLDDHGREHVIAYGGRGLRKSEINWSISELECLAIIEGTRNYHTYLASRPFCIVTDHVSLTYLKTLKAGRGRLQRWALHLQGYNFTVRYKAGKTLTSADGLSRRDYPTPESEMENDDDVLDDSNFIAHIDADIFDSVCTAKHTRPKNRERYSINFEYELAETDSVSADTPVIIAPLADNYDIPQAQRVCPDFSHIIDYLSSGILPDNDIEARRVVAESEHYSLLDGKLFHLHRPRTKGKHRLTPVVQQLCLPRTLRDEVFQAYHTHNGHPGFDKLYETIRNKYYWPRMYAELSQFVKCCKDCQETKRPVHNKKAPLKSLPVEDVFSRFHLDFLGPLPPSNGFRYILVAIDSTSLFPEIHPTQTCDADETAKVLYEQVFCRYGCPFSILTDRGANFRSSLISALCQLFKVKQIFTSSYHPQTNSRAENMNSIILKSLRIYCTDQTDWSTLLPAISWSYRASTTTSLGFSPFRVLFGKEMRTPIDTSLLNDIRTSPSIDAYMQQMLPKIELTRKIACDNINDCNNRTQFYYNRDTAYPSYVVGQKVLLYDPVTGKGVAKKLKRRWVGPFLVTDVGAGYTYKLRRCDSGQLLKAYVHSNRLRPFHESRTATDTATASPSPVLPQPSSSDQDTATALPDGWFAINKITNRKTIAGKPHYLVHWTDGTKTYEPEQNITQVAKDAYFARCRARRKRS